MVQKQNHPLESALLTAFSHLTVLILLVATMGAATFVSPPKAEAAYAAPKATWVPVKNARYQIKVSWSGTTGATWHAVFGKVGATTWDTHIFAGNVTSAVYPIDATGSNTCGINYKFSIAAGDKYGAPQSPWTDITNIVPPCPTATLTSLSSNQNMININWNNDLGFATSYKLYIKNGGGAYSAIDVAGTGYNYSGSCQASYTFYVVAYANGQHGSNSGTKSISTTCSDPSSGSGGDNGGGTVNVDNGGDSSSYDLSGSSGADGSVMPPPSAPSALNASLVSAKVVSLSWTAGDGVDHYVVQRSTDNTNWQDLNTTTTTSFEDDTADYNTQYYYRVQSVGADGQSSDWATTQTKTAAFDNGSSRVISDDGVASVDIPKGAIDGNYTCTLDKSGSLSGLGKKAITLAGPYTLLCTDADGNVINDFNQPLNVTVKASSAWAKKYKNITAGVGSGNSWKATKSSTNKSGQLISFQLTSATGFAVVGQKKANIMGLILGILGVLLLIGLLVFLFFWWRRRQAAAAEAANLTTGAAAEFQQALAAPDCVHKAQAQQVIPSSTGCTECEQQGTKWNALRICLICGHVGCSDDSSEQHAYKHFQATGHPIVYEYGNPAGDRIGWCYIDQTYI